MPAMLQQDALTLRYRIAEIATWLLQASLWCMKARSAK
jgi:hypothetical protein